MSTLKLTRDGVALIEVTYDRCVELLGLGASIACGPASVDPGERDWGWWKEPDLDDYYSGYSYYVRVDA